MILYIDIVSRKIISSPRLKRDVSRIEVKRGDVIPLSIVFVQNGQSVSLSDDETIVFCAKLKNDNDGAAMVIANDFVEEEVNGSFRYNGYVNFDGSLLAQEFSNDPEVADEFAFIDLQMEVNWENTVSGENNTTNTIILRVYNDVFKGGEVPPILVDGVAFQFPDGIKTDTISALTEGGSVVISSTLIASHIHGNLAGNVYAHARAGETLTKGDPVYVSGYHGSGTTLIPEVSKADASVFNKIPAVGIVDADATNGSNCHVVIIGTITELDTDAYEINTPLYVADGGGLTDQKPSSNAQTVAVVERSNSNNGAILVKINGLNVAGDWPKMIGYSIANGSTGTIALYQSQSIYNKKPYYYQISTRYCRWVLATPSPYWEFRNSTLIYRSTEDVKSPDLVTTWTQTSGTTSALTLFSSDVVTLNSMIAAGSDQRYGGPIYVSTLANNTSYVNDIVGSVIASVTLPAGTYEVEVFARFSANTANSRIAPAITSGASELWTGYKEAYNNSGAIDRVARSNVNFATGGPWSPSTNYENHGRYGILKISAEATYSIYASQSASSPTTTTVSSGAYIIARKIA